MNVLNKISSLLSQGQKKQFLILLFFMFIGMGLEVLGIGIIVPVLGAILDIENQENVLVRKLVEWTGANSGIEMIAYVLFVMVLIAVVKIVYLVSLSYFKFRYTARVTRDISNELYKGYLFNPYSYHLRTNTSQMLRNLQIEVTEFNSAFQALMGLITEITVILGMIAILFYYEPIGALTTSFVLVSASVLFQKIIKKSLVKWGLKRQVLDGDLNKVLIQSLNGIKDVKLAGKELFFYSIFKEKIDAKIAFQTKYVTIKNVPRLYLEFLAMVGLVLLIYIMFLQNVLPKDILSTLAVFAAASFKLIPSFNIVMASVQQLRFSESSVNTLFNDINEIQSIKVDNQVEGKGNIEFKQTIRINQATFKFENTDNYLFQNLNLEVKKGAIIGFIGKSGSGKSTLADLIMGLLTLEGGQILVDGKNIQSDIKSWQSKIGYVPQSIYLTDDSIASNIAFGVDSGQINMDRLNSAVINAQLNEFVNSLEFGLMTEVGEGGARLSGGQRQRIGIARALYRNPEILIFDEATSALDNETEMAVMQSIYEIKDKTILIIAHRLSTLVKCDYIYRFERGQIVDQGEPSHLLTNY
ncbi:ABC-type bacteriocin/lantibiotic exporter, contains an N-terminal double-glycine peptidase domain [Daejeonella rubra]|uniref:ABC-type bacteriocin/lantibiotic exporter, contains an N-terminal double-glycine peptidase domain n=1 Tax=Daejeonella rubra TaxID=990371 RepID=A0A1G9WUK7_9SPHI|nr:ABC transporter ATP-binding protein [Daejeonella rubra]SDM88148.1 ABC-type bacteriocin/lantibiotic exporter, contains an N-terminal double-glycine peptidase domain [Daejeonella rubra]